MTTYGPPRRKRALLVHHGMSMGKPVTLACDGRCDKAWGIGGRHRIQLSKDEDDVVALPDDVLGAAPPPGETLCVAHNGRMKPSADALATTDAHRMNAWCLHECERTAKKYGAHVPTLLVPDMNAPRPNVRR